MEIQVNVGTYEGRLLGFTLDQDMNNLQTLYSFLASTTLIKTLYRSGRYLLVGGVEEIVKVYDIRRKIEVSLLEQHNGTITLINGYGNFIFTASEDGNVNLWKQKSWQLITKFECQSPIIDLSIHESGKLLAIITKDKKLHLFNLMNLKRIALKKFNFNILKVHFLSKNNEIQYLFFQSDRKCYIIDCETNKVTYTIDMNSQITDSLLFNNSLILSDSNGLIYMIQLNIENELSHTILMKFIAHEKRVKQIQLFELNNVTLLASISSEGEIKIWDCLLYTNDQFDNIDLQNQLKPCYVIKTNQHLTCLNIIVEKQNNQIQQQQSIIQVEQQQQQQQQQQSKIKNLKSLINRNKNQVKIKKNIKKQKSF